MTARASLYLAAVLWGISLSLFAYRFAVMPLVWPSPMRLVLPGLGCGLFLAGVHIARTRKKSVALPSSSGRYRRSEPLPVMAMLGGFAVGFLPVFAIMWLVSPPLSRSPLSKRELPGFSIALPSGTTATEAITYPAGSIMLKEVGDGTGVVIVSWEPGGNLTRDELRAMLPLFTKAMALDGGDDASTKLGSVAGPDGKPVDAVTFDTDNLDLRLSMLACGVRHIMVATAAPRDVMPLHERIVASFSCHPDEAQETTSTALAFPLALDLPGWYLVARDEEVTQISSDDASLVLRTLPPSLKTPDLATFIKPAFEQTGAHVEIIDKQGSDFIKVKLQDQGDSGMGWVALFRCPTGIALVLGLGHDDATVSALYEKVKTSRCLSPDEKPTQFPEDPH